MCNSRYASEIQTGARQVWRGKPGAPAHAHSGSSGTHYTEHTRHDAQLQPPRRRPLAARGNRSRSRRVPPPRLPPPRAARYKQLQILIHVRCHDRCCRWERAHYATVFRVILSICVQCWMWILCLMCEFNIRISAQCNGPVVRRDTSIALWKHTYDLVFLFFLYRGCFVSGFDTGLPLPCVSDNVMLLLVCRQTNMLASGYYEALWEVRCFGES